MQLDISKVSGKKFTFDWHDRGTVREVEVELPNLEKINFHQWGDWGPMYRFELGTDKRILFKIDQDLEYGLAQDFLEIESPLSANERAEFPFLIKIHHHILEREFRIFLNENLEFGKLKTIENEKLHNNHSVDHGDSATY